MIVPTRLARWLVPAVALGFGLAACSESPADPLTGEVAFNHAGNHPEVSVTITEQPIVFGPIGNCAISYAFKVNAVRGEYHWTTFWIGGNRNGNQVGENDNHGAREVSPTIGSGGGDFFTELKIVIEQGGQEIAVGHTEGRDVNC
ncbi:MAG TPA: hypothetical protein VK837_06605 [Longimicrobiales bacterium]|nr:hypothetical protein [Longimicrobiales bacterium]